MNLWHAAAVRSMQQHRTARHVWHGPAPTQLLMSLQGEVVSERTIWTGCPARPLGWKAAAAYRAAADGDPSPGTVGTGMDKNKSMKDDEGDLEAALLQPSAIELANTSSLPHGLV